MKKHWPACCKFYLWRTGMFRIACDPMQSVINTHRFTSIVQTKDQDAILIPLEHVFIEPRQQSIHPAPATNTRKSLTNMIIKVISRNLSFHNLISSQHKINKLCFFLFVCFLISNLYIYGNLRKIADPREIVFANACRWGMISQGAQPLFHLTAHSALGELCPQFKTFLFALGAKRRAKDRL